MDISSPSAPPCLDRIDCQSEIATEIGEVQQLSAARGKRTQKHLEPGQIAHLAQRPYVALKIGLNVTREPQRAVSIRIGRELWITTVQRASPKRTRLGRCFGADPRGPLPV